MNPVTLLQPPRVVFGNGCSPQAVEFFTQRGLKRVLLVTSKSVRPQIEPLLEVFHTAGCSVIESRFVPTEPTLGFFSTLLTEAAAAKVDAVLGVGGGSAIDVAKLVAALARSEQSAPHVFGVNLLHGRALPLVCLPTTAGTGAEVSPNAILLDEAAQLKKGVVSSYLVPDAA